MPEGDQSARPLIGRSGLVLLVAALLSLLIAAPSVAADDNDTASTPTAAGPTLPQSRLPATDPLNGGFLIVNMHGMLFHALDSDVQEDISYARWLGGGVIRVFGTDNNGFSQWDGARVGNRIADIAPMLRSGQVRLIVALVNNHRAVPGEPPGSVGWMDDFFQLLLPFYTENWRGPYLQFMKDLITTVQARGALDVIYAWELGNELHTPHEPEALMPFLTQAVEEIRALDAATPILPGTMGANHVEPGDPHSSIARWLYCDAPFDAYTLHAYDWVSRARPGDMPIDWDLDNIVSNPCPNGRALPVIIEELGTSRSLDGMYGADDEQSRIAQELRQIQFIRHFPQVVGFGVWNGESPRLVDRTFIDTRRGLTSYGARAQGGGSCYDPIPEASPSARCRYETALRGLHFVRLVGAQWIGDSDLSAPAPLLGGVDPVDGNDSPEALSLSGWVLDPAAIGSTGITGLDVVLGQPTDGEAPLAQAQLGLVRGDLAEQVSADADGNTLNPGFALTIPLATAPAGVDTLTLEAHTTERGTWQMTFQVVMPILGGVPARPALASTAQAPAAATRARLEIQSPQPGSSVSRSFPLDGLAPTMDRVDIFLEPDRDKGGRLVGSAVLSQQTGSSFRATVTIPKGDHTLYVHAHSAVTGGEVVVTLPVTAT